MKLQPTNGGYAVGFDTNYFQGAVPSMPEARVREPSDVAAWLAALPMLKEAMDLWLGKHPKEEREEQQFILREQQRRRGLHGGKKNAFEALWVIQERIDIAAASANFKVTGLPPLMSWNGSKSTARAGGNVPP